MKNTIKCNICNYEFKPKFYLTYACICPKCKNKLKLYKNEGVSKFLGIASVIVFIVLSSIVKYVAFLLDINAILVFLLTLPIFYLIVNPIYYYSIIYIYNKYR